MRYHLEAFRKLSDLEDLRDICYDRAVAAKGKSYEETTRRQLDRVVKQIHDEIAFHDDRVPEPEDEGGS